MIQTILSHWTGASIYFQLFRFFIVLVAGIIFTRAVLMPIIARIYSRKSEKAQHSVKNLIGVLGLFVTFTLALQAGNFGGLVNVLAAIGAAITVAVGFGMRDQVSNLVAGILIHLDNPFIQGDYIRVGDTEGVVKNIDLRATKLNGHENEKQVVPNAMLTTGVVKNYTKARKTKVSIETKIELDKSEKASELLLETMEESEATLNSPDPSIKYEKIEEGKLEMEATFWVKKSGEVKHARSEVLKAYAAKMKEQGLLEKEEKE